MLRGCLREYDLREALKNLPETLSNVYQQMLENIPERRLPIAIRILQLLLFSPEPLTVTDLSHALTVEPNADPYVDTTKCLRDPNDIALYCPDLTVLVEHYEPYRHGHETILQLSHLSIKEYLCSDRISNDNRECFQEQAAKLVLADVCVSYLLHIQEDISADVIDQRFPFAQYCSEHWYRYSVTPRTEPDQLHEKLMELLDQNTQHYTNCMRLHKMDFPFRDLSLDEPASPLYYASYSGLWKEAEMLLVQGADVNAQGGRYNNTLQAASIEGHVEIVKLLLAHKADFNAKGGLFGSALQAASYGGSQEIIALLLACNPDVNAQGGEYGNALQAASFKGYDKIVESLLACNAEVHTGGGPYGSALQLARYGEHDKIVEMLLDHGAIR